MDFLPLSEGVSPRQQHSVDITQRTVDRKEQQKGWRKKKRRKKTLYKREKVMKKENEREKGALIYNFHNFFLFIKLKHWVLVNKTDTEAQEQLFNDISHSMFSGTLELVTFSTMKKTCL